MKTLLRIVSPFLFFAQLSLSCLAQSGIITTYAGPGLPVSGALAVTQPMDASTSVAPGGAGGFYVASPFLNRISRVTAGGTLSLIAGTGTSGFSGDGGPAAILEPMEITEEFYRFTLDCGHRCHECRICQNYHQNMRSAPSRSLRT